MAFIFPSHLLEFPFCMRLSHSQDEMESTAGPKLLRNWVWQRNSSSGARGKKACGREATPVCGAASQMYALALAAWLLAIVECGWRHLCWEVFYLQWSSRLVLVTPLCFSLLHAWHDQCELVLVTDDFVVTLSHHPFGIPVVCLVGGCMNLKTSDHFRSLMGKEVAVYKVEWVAYQKDLQTKQNSKVSFCFFFKKLYWSSQMHW